MRSYPRGERIGAAIQTALAELLRRKIEDPRISMATISSVELTQDLRIAYIYFTVFGDSEKINEAITGFESCKGYIKKNIAPKLGLKYMPELKFIHDKSFDHGSKIDALLNSVIKNS